MVIARTLYTRVFILLILSIFITSAIVNSFILDKS